MRKIFFALLLITSLKGFTQDPYLPDIKQGSQLTFNVNANGSEIPLIIKFDSLTADYIKIGWSLEGMGDGGWIITKPSLDSATRGYWNQPTPGTDEVVPNDVSVFVFSRAQWAAIQNNQSVDFDMQHYTVKTPTDQQQLKLNGKTLNTVFLESESGTHIWLLNNPSLPIMLKIENNTTGIDLALTGIQ